MDGDFVKLMNDGRGRRVDLAVLEMKSDHGAVAFGDRDELGRVLFLQAYFFMQFAKRRFLNCFSGIETSARQGPLTGMAI
ncbi:unnamed protein product [Effrenium voratum]|nr:unnamed protein product [Effrenium voratum]